MTRSDAVQHACETVSIAYHSIRDYSKPSDGFCDKCMDRDMSFHNSGDTLDYVRRAVVQQLLRDGYEISERISHLVKWSDL